MMLVQLSLFLLPSLGYTHGDTFTSIREMENLFDLEQDLAKALDSFLKHANFELEIMEMHYKELSKIESEIQDIDQYAENPVNAYSVIKRMHYIWPVTFKLMENSPFFDEDPKYPDESALTEAITRLVEWQTEKNLETKTLARGLYTGIMPHANLTAFDCFEIAKYCYNKDKKLAVQWLEEAYIKMEEGNEGSGQLLTQILEYTFLAKCLTGDMEGSISALQTLITDGASWYTPSAKLRKDYELDQVKKCERAAKKGLKKQQMKTSSLFKQYNSSAELCNNTRLPTKVDAGECMIRVDWKNANFLKFEFFNDISIVLVHNFLTDDLILNIKQSAMEEFKTLYTKGLNGPVPLPGKKVVASLNKRINTKLGISMDMLADDHQVFAHGPGGKLETFKSYRHQVAGKQSGNLFYYFLNDVAQGGNVIFPDFKLSIEPTKGTLLYWYDREKEVDMQDCPVLVGSKWTMTQSMVEDED